MSTAGVGQVYGLVEILYAYYSGVRWKSCTARFDWNVQRTTPRGKIREGRRMLMAIHAQEDRESAHRKAAEVASKLRALRLDRAACIVAEGCEETLTYYDFPSAHWTNLRTNDPLEQLNREIRRRRRVARSFLGRVHAGKRTAAIHGWSEMASSAI